MKTKYNAHNISSSYELAPKYARATTLAASFGIHKGTIFRWADRGLLHRHKINGRIVLFSVAEVTSLINSARVE